MTSYTLARALPLTSSLPSVSSMPAYRLIARAVDFLVLLLTMVVALVLASGATTATVVSQVAVSLGLVVIWLLTLWYRQTTAADVLGGGTEEYRRVLIASAWALPLMATFAYFVGAGQARWVLLGAVALGTTGLLLGRSALRVGLRGLGAELLPVHRAFVIASPPRAAEIAASIEGEGSRYQQAGVWHLDAGEGDPDPRTVVARALEAGADTILVAPLGTGGTEWTRRLRWAAEDLGVEVLVSPSLTEIAGSRLSVETLKGMAFVRVTASPLEGVARIAKRVLDVVGATLGLIVLGPLLLLVGLLIRRDSAGPAVFKQVRAGLGVSTFECWKFRTMYTGADAERAALRHAQQSEPSSGGTGSGGARSATFKMVDDPRITRVGHWLRKYSIDEIPQLVNVLRGEMSLVGPRPHPLDDVALYDDVATRRLLAKPGMTGLWQVSGRSNLDWEKAVGLDLYYVENWSLGADVAILFRTVKVVLSGSGAY